MLSEDNNIIFYGACATGKSFLINKLTEKAKQYRVSFYDTLDYSNFVGYCKQILEDKTLKYRFVAKDFLKAYEYAWRHIDEDVVLIIEDINRGNCPSIFGNILSLLNRDEDGFSSNYIEVDTELCNYLNKIKLYEVDAYRDYLNKVLKIDVKEPILLLPKNFFIYGSMSTSDKSISLMDTPFKRKFSFKYVPIDYKVLKDVYIDIDGSKYSYKDFLERVNKIIYAITRSEDKQLGQYFVSLQDKVIKEDVFISKILFYLWEEIFKLEIEDERNIFKLCNKNEIFAFSNLFSEQKYELIRKIFSNLKLYSLYTIENK